MKKTVRILIATFVICLSVIGLTRFAKASHRGDIVSLSLVLPASYTSQSFGAQFNYNTDALQLKDGKWNVTGTMLAGVDAAKNTAACAYGSATAISGNVLTVNFEVLSKAVYGDYPVTAVFKVGTTQEIPVTLGTVTVTCAHKNTENKAAVPATCKETGFTAGVYCKDCNTYISGHEIIPVSDVHSYGAWETVMPATCTLTGSKKHICSVCGREETASIAVLGHNWSAWEVTEKPACEKTGKEERHCTREGCMEKQTRTVAATGHHFDNPVTTKEATCTEPGEKKGTCKDCSKETTSVIPAKGHKFGKWTPIKPATCTEGGKEERECSVCHAKETRNTAALGHDFESPKVVREATLTEEGLMAGKCKRCGETTEEAIPCKASDDKTGISVETEEGVFEKGTELVVKEIGKDSDEYVEVAGLLIEKTKTFKLFDISAVLNSAKVQPDGTVKVTFTIPKDFGKNVALFFVNGDTIEEIPLTVSEDGKTAVAEFTHFSYYALAKLDADEEDPSDPTEDTGSEDDPEKKESKEDDTGEIDAVSDILPYAAIGLVIIIIIIIIAVVVAKKKKKNEEK